VRGHKPQKASFREIPAEILRLENLEYLDVMGQPIEIPPPEVVSKGIEAIRDYWRQRVEVGTDYLCEAKLLIVGEADAGKTSLARKIEDPGYELAGDEQSTEGIDVIHWSFPTTLRVEQDGKQRTLQREFNVHTWDFGGQEIYHATHQFFLTRRSLYALVADSRKEDTDFHYWLNVVELLSDGSPLLIVKNEKQDRRRDIAESRLRARFHNLREVLATNLKTNRGLDLLLRTICRHLEGLPHIGVALPATWKRVREAIEKDPRNHITADEFLEICEDNGFTRETDNLQLSGYLHDLGICLHFQDDPLLKRTVILKPKWGTDAVYRVLDNELVVNNHGRFERSDLAAIWSEPEYAAMRDELLQLMIKFQLCYRIEGSDSYIAPQLLSPTPPDYPWDDSDNLVLRYRYDFMPKGIITRFIVAANPLIADQDWVWKDGVVLAKDGARAVVSEDYQQREITARFAGRYRRDLLAIVDHELEKIHHCFPRLGYDTLVPCSCSVCTTRPEPHFYEYQVLRRFAADRKPIQCRISYEMVDVRRLIETVFTERDHHSGEQSRLQPDALAGHRTSAPAPPEPTKEVYVSYAWGGDSEQLVNELEAAFAERSIALIREKNELAYRGSIRRFMERIGRGKCVVVVISKKYLESPNCMYELTEIARDGSFLQRVFPIVLEDAGIFKAICRVPYIKHWEKEISELDQAMKEVEQSHLEGIQEEINRYREIRTTIARLTDIIGDMNALSTDAHRESGFDELISAITAKLSE
jgi:GTPase SAR1 family protein